MLFAGPRKRPASYQGGHATVFITPLLEWWTFTVRSQRFTAPLLVVEHDDRRHRKRPRRASDDFKDSVLAAAGMPVYRIVAQQAYDPAELREQVDRRIAAAASTSPSVR